MRSTSGRAIASYFSRLNTVLSRLLLGVMLACSAHIVGAQTFQLETTTVPVAVVKNTTPFPERIPIVAGPSGLNLTGLTAQSNAAWVSASVDTGSSTLVLTFSTGSLAANSTPSATITLSNGTHSAQLAVSASVSTLNVTQLLDDPVRSRTYAIQQNGVYVGALLIFDPVQETYSGSITLGQKPTDLAISDDGNELLAICSVSQNIYAINLQTLRITKTIPLPSYTNSYIHTTTADVAYGPGDIVYYTDGATHPLLHVLKRSTGQVLQSVTSGVKYGGALYDMGLGDIVVSHDKTQLFGWVQSGWGAYQSSTSSSTARFTINADGTLAASPVLAANPKNRPASESQPALIGLDDQTLILQNQVFDTANMSEPLLTLDGAIYGASPNAEYLSTHNALYEKATGEKLFDLPVSTTVQTFASDYAKLVYFNTSTKAVKTLDLLQALASSLLVRTTTPSNGEITLPPSILTWTPLLGIERYRVYFGTSQNAVAQAAPGSPQDLGEVSSASITLPTAPAPGTTYYWRVDPASGSQTVKGNVLSFTASVFNTSTPRVEAATVQGFAAYRASVELKTATPGQIWSAVSSAPWVQLDETSGATPATLGITLNASQLAAGYHEAAITLTAPGGTAVVSVGLRVDALNLTNIKSAPGSRMVYAISEHTPSAGDTARAYLLEIDSLFKTITKTARVGANVTDLAIHPAENRIYITNTAARILLAVGRDSFAVERTYSVAPDARSVSAAGLGRVFLEAYGSLIIMDTITGETLASRSSLSDFGASDPTGRYYYDTDSSLVKYDTNTNAFVWQTTQTARASINYNNGPWRTIVSEDGQRIFWGGSAHDENLNVEWVMEDSIQCASADGRYAFSKSVVYDVTLKKALQPMPVTTAVSAHNSVSGNLVVQNGASLGFFRFAGQTTPGSGTSPVVGSLVEPPAQLQWPSIPGATGYRVYLGTSSSSVEGASTGSDEYLGETTTGVFTIPSALSVGQTYYWRVDVIIDGKVAKGDAVSFTTAPFSANATSISTSTVQGYATHTATIDLTSSAPGQSWAATSSATWISFKHESGVTPASIKVVLDASKLPVGVHQSTMSLSWTGGSLAIPVSITVDPLTVTVMRSQAGSTKLYAISEAANGDLPTKAYLLEIDSLLKSITRTTRVGRNATSLAIHDADNRIYINNWQAGYIHAVDLDTFDISQTYPLQNTHALSAGSAGRLIYMAGNLATVSLLNTDTGAIIGSMSAGQGGGAFEPTGRYYFHGESNSAPPSIRKVDTSGDTLTQSASSKPSGVNSYGSRSVVMAESGERLFWNGIVLDQDLAVQWRLPENIYSVSSDGRYAFSETKIYDVAQKKLLKAMPVATTVSAFNTATGRLVVQKGAALDFSSPVGPGLLGDDLFPTNLQVVAPPEQLRWKAIPGALAYRVYLGASAEAVEEATPDSDEYLGEVTDPAIDLALVPPAGQTRYWRVDVVMPGDVTAKGDLLTFFTSLITPDISVIDAVTVQGHVDYSVATALSSAISGKTWTASSPESWIHVEATAGSTPATLDISLDASRLDEGSYRGSVVVTTTEGSFPITVQLKVEAQSIRVLKSAPNSSKVYAISEKTYDVAPIAYLLEIDTELSCITRVLPVGTGATGLAVHVADNRVYVTNPRMGSLFAIGIDDFLVKRVYELPLSTTFGDTPAHYAHAGLAGRLILQNERLSELSLLNTTSGAILATVGQYPATKGTADPTGRYFYNGNYNGIRKIDTQGDVFNQSLFTPTSGSYTGGGVMSGNGQRLYFEARAYTADLVAEGSAETWVYATTYDGGMFFSSSSVQEFPSLKVVMSLPVIGSYAYAYNDTTQTLVLLVDNRIGYYALKAGSSLPKPVLSADNITHGSVRIGWETRALETGSVLEYRRLGAAEWTVVPTLPYAYIKTATISGLRPETAYEFRAKAISPVALSTWSDPFIVTTPEGPPFIEMPAKVQVQGGTQLVLPIEATGSGNTYEVTGLPPGMSYDAINGVITGSSTRIGNHSVTITGTNSLGTRSQTFVIAIGSNTRDNARGRYAGLIYSNVLLAGSWVLDRSGNAFTGSYNCSGGIMKFKGAFPASGELRTVQIVGRLSGAEVVLVATWDRFIDRITLDVDALGYSGETFEDTGLISSWNASSSPFPKAGLFNSLILPTHAPSASLPEGYGFMSLNFTTAGTVTAQGESALGNKITWSGVVQNNHVTPAYWKSGDSILWGVIVTDSEYPDMPPVFGSLAWSAVPNPGRKAYTSGFSQVFDVMGSRFTPGKSGTDLFRTSNSQVVQLGGAGLDRVTPSFAQPFVLSGKKVVFPAGNPGQMKLTLTPKTGLVTGTVVITDPHPSGGASVKRTVAFRGMMLRKTHHDGVETVGGYFQLPGWNGQVRSGWMQIAAPAP